MSIYVEWARDVIKNYIEKGEIIHREDFLDAKELDKQAACFVSIHLEDGSLRGCIGTILPYEDTLYYEIRNNAISAATRDPRFNPIGVDELDKLKISVDVLSAIEEVEDITKLNPKKYGVIVEKNGYRGLLLPNLDGVDTVEMQLHIAKQKAGLASYANSEINISSFTVERYH